MFQDYLSMLEERYSKFFNIHKNVKIHEDHFSLYAYSEIHNEKYFGSKSLKIWRAENYEHCFVKTFSDFNEHDFSRFTAFLESAVETHVRPHHEHMSTTITGVALIPVKLTPSIEKRVRKYSYRKNFKWTLYGWAEVRLIIVSLSEGKVCTNRKGREVAKFYQPLEARDEAVI
ncbi:hypothetical protein L1765_13570 [Microaerobacter geothermalis]|uniref:hypothetical protein n=1 Tax=Microaerobacter geothermalis TaxID=674972 RepID=UPI001F2BCA4C|nr:hypothetical protein [Microaerobacter geothermalis]MCF6094990.1 hypothetical protein [Microaerobacter geothermalis]